MAKIFGTICIIAGLIWLSEFVMYLFGVFEPKPLTIGLAMFLTSWLMFKWAYEYFTEEY